MATLTELISESNAVLNQIIDAGGELTEEIEKALATTTTELQTKVDSYVFIMEKLDSEAEFYKQKAEQYLKISKACKNLKERINQRTKEIMETNKIYELKGFDYHFKLTPTQSALLIDESKLTGEYKILVTSYEPDKERIKKALLLDEKIEGATLEKRYSLRSYINKK